ncbi:MAG TPA: tetratricopeptide repeat protein [Candidatus Eisenbacteria bacterium]|nr:tetratricopeptide repeat protein [Candidatus Eisenbacteria bacterium]
MFLGLGLATVPGFSQSARAPDTAHRTGSNPASLERAIGLASKGQCEAALPLLQRLAGLAAERDLKYRALMATVRCGLSRRDDRATANALLDLKRDFPNDPEVLYKTSQIFLEMAERASQELTIAAPDSYQTQELKAEALESQEKWAQAADIYRQILREHPTLRGIHYRLGHAAISQPESPTSEEDAKKEFEQELAIDPVNAAAEFWLGEIARRHGQWDAAISHFTAAAKLDSNFADALLSLGTSLNSAGRFSDAIPPLEQYAKIVPRAIAGHYQLYLAYVRTGRKEEAEREMLLHKKLVEKSDAKTDSKPDTTPH